MIDLDILEGITLAIKRLRNKGEIFDFSLEYLDHQWNFKIWKAKPRSWVKTVVEMSSLMLTTFTGTPEELSELIMTQLEL